MRKTLLGILLLSAISISLPAQKTFRLNAIGDIQVGTRQELEYADKSIFQELMSRPAKELNIFLGDQVNDVMPMMPMLKDRIGRLPQESLTVIGNHDLDADTSRIMKTATYTRLFGSPVRTLRKGRYHFVTLNNVYGTGLRGYTGRIDREQLDFLRAYISRLGRKDYLVLCMHIPFSHTENRNEVVDILKGRGEVLLLSGHLHEIMRNVIKGEGVTIHEVSAGAVSGMWWRGQEDWDGVPAAIMQSGSPRGYFIFDFGKKGYSFRFKGVGLDEKRQMTISISGLNDCDSKVDSLRGRAAGSVYTTVYGAYEDTEVLYRVDGGPWEKALKVKAADANVARMQYLNNTGKYPSGFSRKQPLRGRASSCVWYAKLPETCMEGLHRIEFRASDQYGFSARGSRMFSLD